MLVIIKKEERNNLIYTTYEGKYSEFPPYDDELGTRSSILTNETTGICRATYFKSKKENFISKIRALTEEHKQLSFSQKYPVLALDIENAAKEGKNYIYYILTEKTKSDLRAEGFTIEDKPYREKSKISW